MAVKASNQTTVIDITDGYSVTLTNDNYTFLGDTDSVDGTQTTTCQVQVLCGAEQVPCSIGDITLPTGLSIVSDGKTPIPTLTITATSALTTAGSVLIPVKIGDVTISKTFSYSIAFRGAKGEPGERGLQGLQGPKGERGIPGPKGDAGSAGKTSYFHIKYSSVANPTSSSQMTETPSTYIGTYVDFVQEDSADPTKYTWSRFAGAQGAKGEQGIAGVNGADGKTSYLHIAYANSADGRTGFSTTDGTNKLYIGQYTDYTQADSTDATKYTWTKIKGEQGIQGTQGPQGIAGKDAIDMVITSSNGVIFKNTDIATTLTAHVYKGGAEVTGSALTALGVIKWYKDGGTTAIATGQSLTLNAGDVKNKATYTAQLEG